MNGNTLGEIDNDDVFRWPAFEKRDYRKIIHSPEAHIDASRRLDFYEAAKESVRRVLSGTGEIEGTAALYLFRHYLELVLKDLVHGSRLLKTKEENMPTEQVVLPQENHNLLQLWREIENQLPKKVEAGVWSRWDYRFAAQCIEEFHALDPSGVRLRYSRESSSIERDRLNPVRVDWEVLFSAMQHVRDVLEAMASYLTESHALNAEWEAEQNSW